MTNGFDAVAAPTGRKVITEKCAKKRRAKDPL
jgi:hypothetical protein